MFRSSQSPRHFFNVLSFYGCFVVIVFAMQSSCQAEGDQPLTAEMLIALYTDSYNSIKTAEVSYDLTVDNYAGQGVKKGADGRGILNSYTWSWEKQSGKESLVGEWSWQEDSNLQRGLAHYVGSKQIFDGKQMHTLNEDARAGKISVDPRLVFNTYRGPFELAGRRFAFMPNRDLPDLLLTGAKLIDEYQGVYLLEGYFEQGGSNGYKLNVWIDANHGFLPSKFTTYELSTNGTLHKEYKVTKFKKVGVDLWFPVEGNYTFYYIASDFTLPDNLTTEEVKQLSKLELEEVRKRTTFKSVPMGAGTYYYNVDENSLKINHEIDKSRFKVKYPKGYRVFNEITNESYVSGEEDVK